MLEEEYTTALPRFDKDPVKEKRDRGFRGVLPFPRKKKDKDKDKEKKERDHTSSRDRSTDRGGSAFGDHGPGFATRSRDREVVDQW